ncbi:di-heme oxidoreductase family protein (plasmid) [Pseudoalteromonas sp. T1lg65]|uniref:di-heme oxidoreductase family protein n=1 Tax=Pseudoalteromonas sp. T1lg65 TaxID=2077101 RepID=UPI003F790A3B
MKKSIILLFPLLLSACGGSGGSTSETSKTTTDNTDKETTTPTATNHAFAFDTLDGQSPLLVDQPDEQEHLSAGQATTSQINENAFGQALPAIVSTPKLDAVFKAGDHIFRSNHDGQGPIFNQTSCQGCHLKDGRGELPATIDETMTSTFFRVGTSEAAIEPTYGDQLQVFGTALNGQGGLLAKYQGAVMEGVAYGEAKTWIEYDTIEGEFADGERYTLRQPIYKASDLSYGDFVENVRFSARVSPHVFGSGLLESIPEEQILAHQDEQDSNKDGISGRAAFTHHPLTGEKQLARFGYKAVTATVLQQITGAYRGDMGVTTSVTPKEVCTEAQAACIEQANTEQDKYHDGVDLNDVDLAQVEFYNRTLAVPKRRGYDENTQSWDPQILNGRAEFFAANCHSCHVPRFKTGEAVGSHLGDVDLISLQNSRTNITALEQQVIYPFSDLLLHDMGGSCQVFRELKTGEACDGSSGNACLYVQRCTGLADGRPEGEATGTEWKTPPLWGLGLVNRVNQRATFLHDGRARNIQEAILWHAGEAEAAKQHFVNLPKQKRQALLAFLGSL